jgi:hypothetical protein
MSFIKMFLISMLLCSCVVTCTYLNHEPDQGVTTIPDPASAIERIRIGISLWVIMDHTTGCQLIETDVGIYPRMNADGTQYCIDNIAIDTEGYDPDTTDEFPGNIPSTKILE